MFMHDCVCYDQHFQQEYRANVRVLNWQWYDDVSAWSHSQCDFHGSKIMNHLN
jgi:hypothetical protein